MNEVTIVMKPKKICKGSVRYAASDEKAPVQDVYVDKSFASPMPSDLEVVVRVKA